MPSTAAADRLWAELAGVAVDRANRLAQCTEEPPRLTRRFATPALGRANALVLEWMREAGMSCETDAVGNVRGRFEGAAPEAPALLLGSHLDTVRDAGRWDGVLGVVVALAVVAHLHRRGPLPIAIEVAGFADEEGVRYGVPYLGSSALAGSFEPDWLSLLDVEGVPMAAAIAAFGGDPAALASARRDPGSLLGYAEVHIEQGPVLERNEQALGVATGIAGQSRAAVAFVGRAGHAGTVPMELRRDALCAAAELVLAAEERGRAEAGLVATVGSLQIEPGAANSVPGRALVRLDVRHGEDPVRLAALAELRRRAGEIAAPRGLEVEWETLLEQPAVACDRELTELLASAASGDGRQPLRLVSGAGHDVAVLADHTPSALLFVRCAEGLSHHPGESVAAADVAAAIAALAAFVELVAARRDGR